jgi:RNA polymerase sigma factor (sigma-70 family)
MVLVVTDEERVRAAMGGDHQAFAELVGRYRDAVYGVCYHRAGDAEEAKDLAQEAFLRAYLDLGQLRDPRAFPAWLRRVAERVCATWRRRRRLQTTSLETAPEPRTYADLDLPLAVRQALMRLSDDARLALTLYYVNGYSTREVGEFLGVPTGTVKSRLYHARRRFKEEFMDEYRDALRQSAPGPEFEGAVVRAVRSLEEARGLPGAQRFKRLESPADLDHFLVLEKDGTIIGECWYDIQEMPIRGVTVRIARNGYTTGESVKGGQPEAEPGIYDRLATAALANAAQAGFGWVATHEIMVTAIRVGHVPCYYHYRIRAAAADLLRGEVMGSVREYRDSDAEAVAALRRLPRARPEMWAWQGPSERPWVLEREGAVVGCYSMADPARPPEPGLLCEMEGRDMAAYRAMARHWGERAIAEGLDAVTTYLSPQHPLGSYLVACGGVCEMQGASVSIAKDEEHLCIVDLVAALRAVAPGLGRPTKGRVSIDMDGQVATIGAGDPPTVEESAPRGAAPSRIGRVPMTQLAAGYRSVFEIIGRPDVAIADADYQTLDALFPKTWPYSWPDPYIWEQEAFRESRPWAFEEPWASRIASHPRPWA